jgi:lipoprotein-releasing system permease protein
VFANLFIAARYLSGKNRGGGRYLLVAMCGIALSLVPVIVTLIVADGMIRGITDRFIELGTGHIQVWAYREPPAPLTTELQDVRAIVAALPEVRGVWKQREALGVIVGKNGKTGGTIRALEPSFWQDAGSARYLTAVAGSAAIEADNEVLLGQELAEMTGAEPGKTIRLMTLRAGEDGRSVPKVTLFTVKGIISSGYHELDAMWCIISYDAALTITQPPPAGDTLIVKVDDAYKHIDSTAQYINWQIPDNWWAYKWKDILRSQYTSYESTRQLLLFIMLLIVIVAAVNVSSAISMLVIDRQRDIAVLKAFGAAPKSIRAIFVWGSFLTGLTGSILGICAGLAIGCSINHILRGIESVLNFFSALFSGWTIHLLEPSYYLQTIPIIIDWKAIVLIGLFTILCACISGAFPAHKAGSAKPSELLRKF